MDLYEELLALIDLFDAEHIDYALCGGIAVAFHGYPRFTKDIDILIHEDDLHRVRTVTAVQGFTFDSGRIPFGAGGPNERIVYRISKIEQDEILTLDLLLVSPVLQEVWKNRELFEWQERRVCIVSAQGLAVMKRLAGRDQDNLDLKKLGFSEESDDDQIKDDTENPDR